MDKTKGFDQKRILEIFLESLLKLQNVERGSVWIRDGEQYVCIEALGEECEKIKGLAISNAQPSIVGWVIEKGRMTIGKAGEDQRHFEKAENDLKTKSSLIICFPLILETGEVYGAIELIDTSATGSDMNLEPDHLALIENIISFGSIALSQYTAHARQVEENRALRNLINGFQTQHPIIGRTPSILKARQKTKVFAASDYPVLITGESGTGKELFARELHQQSRRREKPFLIQNCSAIPENLLESELFGHRKGAFTGATQNKTGLFEAAHEGTLFLDEIGDMPMELQAKILRALEQGEVKPVGSTESIKIDVRIISATNIHLKQAIMEKRFREDLFYRLNVLPLHIPPLRDRKEDIPLLLKSFLALESKKMNMPVKRISRKAIDHLMEQPWPGNIRELRNLVRHIMVTAPEEMVKTEDLPLHLSEALNAPEAGDEKDSEERVEATAESVHKTSKTQVFEELTFKSIEKAYILFLLEKYRWNITRSAKAADMNRSTFDSRMKRLGIRKSSVQNPID